MLTQLCLRGRVLLVLGFFSVIGVTAICGQAVTSVPIVAGSEHSTDIAMITGQAQETATVETQTVSALVSTKQAAGRDVVGVA
jgi:hypothetical protein